LARQHEQFGIGGEHVAQGIVERASGVDAAADIIDEFVGNVQNAFVFIGHVGERPGRMSLAVGAVAGGFAAADKVLREGTGEEIVREGETPERIGFAFPPARSVGTFGLASHLTVIILKDYLESKSPSKKRK
jgi:hypothetical protein